jgi:hypothetical protein
MSEKNEQLWPDERIVQAFITIADDDGQVSGGDVMLVIQGMRDEYEEKINELEERWEEFQSEAQDRLTLD